MRVTETDDLRSPFEIVLIDTRSLMRNMVRYRCLKRYSQVFFAGYLFFDIF